MPDPQTPIPPIDLNAPAAETSSPDPAPVESTPAPESPALEADPLTDPTPAAIQTRIVNLESTLGDASAHAADPDNGLILLSPEVHLTPRAARANKLIVDALHRQGVAIPDQGRAIAWLLEEIATTLGL